MGGRRKKEEGRREKGEGRRRCWVGRIWRMLMAALGMIRVHVGAAKGQEVRNSVELQSYASFDDPKHGTGTRKKYLVL